MTREILSAILAAFVAGILLFPITLPHPTGGFSTDAQALGSTIVNG